VKRESWLLASVISPRFKPYPAYKESGVAWLGKIPAHWEVKRLKFVAPVRSSKLDAKPDDAVYVGLEHVESWTGQLLLDKQPDSVDSVVALFSAGDVLFGKLRPYLAKAARPDFDGVCTSEILPLQPTAESSQVYVMYCLLNAPYIRWLDSLTYGTKMPRVSPEQIGSSFMPVPPLPDQRAIAAFLDRETARIDALVAKKERLIELLQEKRTALITRAVTRGLDPNVPVKESGVTWLGKIPAHWEVKPLRWVLSIRSGEALSNTEFELTESAERIVPVIGGNGVMGYANLSNIGVTCIAVGRVGALCGNVHLVVPPAWVTDNALLLSDIQGFNQQYLALLLEAMDLNRWASQNAQPLITGAFIKAQRVCRPSLPEQQHIVECICAKTKVINTLIQHVRDAIDRLKEYRTALISAAVTGKIDVRNDRHVGANNHSPLQDSVTAIDTP
jgi:type I restriction enzyme S subunit